MVLEVGFMISKNKAYGTALKFAQARLSPPTWSNSGEAAKHRILF